ncbi:hypothetical protein ACIU1J_32210 [Azospirillum doebereinerae]|uniref:hypothetical protein n=1 Tax=Azospirillum doebereinerae TaxID=92933 RepID=UPI001EE5DDA5|nr:hypothetical protein [Azospirillum doebereinerae]MCG5238394.1 hypothetical protein [Azospirillum doebereinerae]
MTTTEPALYWTHRAGAARDMLELLFVRGHVDPAAFVLRVHAATKQVAETLQDAAAIAGVAPEHVQHGYGCWVYQLDDASDVRVLNALPNGGPPDVPDADRLAFEIRPDPADPATFPITSAEVSYDDLPAMH